jgi:hypothetical protein
MGKLRLYFYYATLIISVILAVTKNSSGQETNVPGEIRWSRNMKIIDQQSGREISILNFQNAVYNNSTSHLPYFQDRIKLTGGSDRVQIKFNNLYFEELKPDEILPSLEFVTDSIIINTSQATERKESYFMYSFVPLRKNPATGKIERLRYFSLNVTTSKQSFGLKSSKVLRFSDQSVLSTGDWLKFYVTKSGMYQITYSNLKDLGLKDPENVRIYGNGGKMLPAVYTGTVPDDLKEIPIMMETGADGIFNEGDYILFYAEGPVTWEFDKVSRKYIAHKHPFVQDPSSENSKTAYFITSQPGGSRISPDTASAGDPTLQINSYDGLAYHERNLKNMLQSGQMWYGEEFGSENSRSFSFSFPDLVTSEPVLVESEILGRAGVQNYFSFQYNNQVIGSVGVPAVSMNNNLALYGQPAVFSGSFNATTANINLQLNYINNGDPAGLGWLRYIRMTARETLNFSSPQFSFRDKRSVGNGNISMFSISNASESSRVWDISDIHNVIQMSTSLQSKVLSFKAKTDSLREFVAFDLQNGFYTPEYSNEKVSNQNLHGFKYADLIIVSPLVFKEQAERLANLHKKKDGLSYIIVTPDQIYNEFSSGMPDPAAIRNFMKMFRDRASSSSEMPRYLLLFGDGSYDNRKSYTKKVGNTNFIITYESANSLDPTNTFVSDDYFGLLDDNETIVVGPYTSGPYTNGLLDIGIGRIPVDTLEQAKAVVDKIEKYMSSKSLGDWRNSICFVGDDEDDNIHMYQADQLAKYVTKNYPAFNIEKIYLDAYQQVSTSVGQRYPDVNKAITNQLNKGLLIFNYTGHGGESGLAHEQIMRQTEDIQQWRNANYPLFVTATCDFARFDRYEGITAGEDVLLNPKGGGIALFTTNRLVYSAPNFVLNQQFYNVAFEKDSDNPAYRLGDIIRKTKNKAGTDINKLNFALLGDPALSLRIPAYKIVTDSINHKSPGQSDTLKAYGNVTIKGHIEDENSIIISNYKGIVVPIVFDKPRKTTSLSNDGGEPFIFNLQDKILFKGKASVVNGEFTVNFMLPRDIDYNCDTGKISYYASDSLIDATGYYNKITIGGLSETADTDNVGPKIRLYINDTTFLDGGVTDEFPTLLALVSDNNGINPGGNSLGHDITAILDDDTKQTYVLNTYFQSDIDNFKQGSVFYKFPHISPGNHKVTFKIWDIFNNSSLAELNFKVLGGNSPSIQRVFNYPNPFSDYTNFFFEHNQTSEDLNVTIEICNMAGSKVREINTTLNASGFTSGPITWDGKDGNGNKILNGIYIYRIILRSLQGTTISKAQKMVVISQ